MDDETTERPYAWVANDFDAGEGWWLVETATEDRSLAFLLALDALGFDAAGAAAKGIELDVMRVPAFDRGAYARLSEEMCAAIVSDLYRARDAGGT